MKHFAWILLVIPLLGSGEAGCGDSKPQTSASGIKKATVTVQTDPEGYSIEQRNVMNRLILDNKPGSIKHLYIISSMSGQVLLYSTVKGKVTSSGKRLTPKTVANGQTGAGIWCLPTVDIGGSTFATNEVLQDDGTYGDSIEYVYWWDVRGAYHQHYVSGGQILHVSDQPIAVKDIVLNLENSSR